MAKYKSVTLLIAALCLVSYIQSSRSKSSNIVEDHQDIQKGDLEFRETGRNGRHLKQEEEEERVSPFQPHVQFPHNFELENPSNADSGEEVYERDIILTEEQKNAFASRKAYALLSTRWPAGSDGCPHIPYVYGDVKVNRAAVRAGIRHWEERTCIKFEETTNTSQPHLRFVKLNGCYSYLGYISSMNGQTVSIGHGCTAKIDLSVDGAGTSGTIVSPSHKRQVKCEWWIIAPTTKRIKATFYRFKVKKTKHCRKNYLVINRFGDCMYPRRASSFYCGKKNPSPVTSDGTRLYLAYITKHKTRGFKLHYQVVD